MEKKITALKKSRSKSWLLLTAGISFIAVVLRPIRAVVGQDDASYAVLANRIAHGFWMQPNLLLAAAWPQAMIGAGAARAFSSLNPLSIYMALTFLFFATNAFLLVHFTQKRAVDYLNVASLCLFPVTLQYGLGFMSETYAISFVLLLFLSTRRWVRTESFLASVAIIVLCIAVVVQRQVLAVVPVVLFVAIFFKHQRKFSWPLAIGLITALFVYMQLPKSFLQQEMLNASVILWSNIPPVTRLLRSISIGLQFTCAIGLFLFPFTLSKRLTWQACFAFAIASVVFTLSPAEPISAGVLFTNYFPKPVAASFVALGVFGLTSVVELLTRCLFWERVIYLSAGMIFIGFLVFSNAGDIKYVLPISIALAVPLLEAGGATAHKTSLVVYLAAVGVVSLFVNSYYLDTLDARWGAANQLEARGVAREEISAGYGRDSYYFGEACFEKVIHLYRLAGDAEKAEIMQRRIMAVAPRFYADERIFKFIVKPAVIYGHHLTLEKNVEKGQDGTPIKILNYRSFGLMNAVAIFENETSSQAWCDRNQGAISPEGNVQ